MTASIYVAETNRCYATGTTESDALIRMASYWHGDEPDAPVTTMVAEAKGYEGGELFRVDADEVVSRRLIEIEPEDFVALMERAEARADDDIVAERAVVNAKVLEE